METLEPQFSGNSFIELPAVEGLSRETSLELQMLAMDDTGLLFYANHGGRGDFLSLQIKNSTIVLQLDLGISQTFLLVLMVLCNYSRTSVSDHLTKQTTSRLGSLFSY